MRKSVTLTAEQQTAQRVLKHAYDWHVSDVDPDEEASKDYALWLTADLRARHGSLSEWEASGETSSHWTYYARYIRKVA